MKIKIKQLFDEITRQKVYPLTTLKAVRDPKSKKALDEMLLIGEEGVEAEEVAQRDADLLGGKYKATDIDRAVTFDSEETEEVEDVSITDADRLGGKYTATDVDALKQRIVELEAENEKLNSNLDDLIEQITVENVNITTGWSYIPVELPLGYVPVSCVATNFGFQILAQCGLHGGVWYISIYSKGEFTTDFRITCLKP